MGLFSRSESAAAARRPVTRASTSSETLAQELRSRARRRLIGALVLVLAAVVIVPMLLDSTPAPKQANAPLAVPAVIPPASSQGGAATGTGLEPSDGTNAAAATPDAGAANAGDSGAVAQGGAVQAPTEPAAPVASGQVEDNPPAAKPEPPVARNESRPETPARHETHPAAKPKPEAKPEPRREARAKGDSEARTDDGSVAIALLEGRKPAKSAPAPSAHGNFVLQIAAYTADKDAQSRRERLVAAGVTNAYVESGTANGKPTYRLRVGPFPTRDAAQAAQARLRALGYDNGFISTK
ncbi:SPOR domain-containing protein [Candidimonas humi]|uniref:SPOR domain-containing protein n=1 Tax=Candidimonas humi TaxID=683355 RepID=A0ABV8NVK4_9BURK|nr:SPOR domain-containing protein [Candidimonas humi]MBV6303620.1 SPOR domain-containing protein [Candidimonas humi]